MLLVANALLYASWPWLRAKSLGSDSTDTSLFRSHKSGQPWLDARTLICNDKYMMSFFNLIHANKQTLVIGTSESTTPYNIPAQLNHIASGDTQMVLVAQPGMSPIHSSIAIAKCKREGVRIPPIVILVNLIYFTESHDVINDGWLSNVIRSPVFMQMGHRDVRSHLSKEVQMEYSKHFSLRNIFYPVAMQEYLGNLIYLNFHQASNEIVRSEHLLVPSYEDKGWVPEYDKTRCVWQGYHPSDQIAKDRWKVKEVENCINLKGLASITENLRNDPTPVLLVILPMNRQFYEQNGLDMSEYNRRFGLIRNEIKNMTQSKNINLIDLYDSPKLHLGFKDRMHTDEYGNFQLSKHVSNTEEYKTFLEAVDEYY